MAQAPENWFILTYDVLGRSVDVLAFESDYVAAADAYTRLEAMNREDAAKEVVLVGADSIETIQRTHSHYFVQSDADLFEALLKWASASLKGSAQA